MNDAGGGVRRGHAHDLLAVLHAVHRLHQPVQRGAGERRGDAWVVAGDRADDVRGDRDVKVFIRGARVRKVSRAALLAPAVPENRPQRLTHATVRVQLHSLAHHEQKVRTGAGRSVPPRLERPQRELTLAPNLRAGGDALRDGAQYHRVRSRVAPRARLLERGGVRIALGRLLFTLLSFRGRLWRVLRASESLVKGVRPELGERRVEVPLGRRDGGARHGSRRGGEYHVPEGETGGTAGEVAERAAVLDRRGRVHRIRLRVGFLSLGIGLFPRGIRVRSILGRPRERQR